MAKRLTDTSVWSEDWFIELPIKYKLVWKYVIDNCDNSGLWKVNKKTSNMLIGEEIDYNDFLLMVNQDKIDNPRIIKIDECHWFIPSFFFFHYGHFNPRSLVQKGIFRTFVKNKIHPKIVLSGEIGGIESLTLQQLASILSKKGTEAIVEAFQYPINRLSIDYQYPINSVSIDHKYHVDSVDIDLNSNSNHNSNNMSNTDKKKDADFDARDFKLADFQPGGKEYPEYQDVNAVTYTFKEMIDFLLRGYALKDAEFQKLISKDVYERYQKVCDLIIKTYANIRCNFMLTIGEFNRFIAPKFTDDQIKSGLAKLSASGNLKPDALLWTKLVEYIGYATQEKKEKAPKEGQKQGKFN